VALSPSVSFLLFVSYKPSEVSGLEYRFSLAIDFFGLPYCFLFLPLFYLLQPIIYFLFWLIVSSRRISYFYFYYFRLSSFRFNHSMISLITFFFSFGYFFLDSIVSTPDLLLFVYFIFSPLLSRVRISMALPISFVFLLIDTAEWDFPSFLFSDYRTMSCLFLLFILSFLLR
jgi:hypothetical protein